MNEEILETSLDGTNAGIESVTADTKVDEVQEDSSKEEKAVTPDDVAKTFTQKQVSEMIKARLDRNSKSFFNRYGVKDRGELDGLIGKAQSYEVMKERYSALKDEISSLKERLAFLNNGISPEREEDVRAYFKGKGLDFSEETLAKELETHPEWRKVVEQHDETPKTTIKTLGVEHRDRDVPETEAEKLKRIYGI